MKKLILLFLLVTSPALALDVDVDANNATDIAYGGTNGTSVSTAQTNLELGATDNVVHSTLNVTGANGLSAGTASTNNGNINLKNSTTAFYFDIIAGAFTESHGWTLPLAYPTDDGAYIDTSTTGVMTYSNTKSHGGMHLDHNANAQTPVAGDNIGLTNFVASPLNGFTFHTGEAGTFSATTDNGTDVTLTTGVHTVEVGDIVVISQTTTTGSYVITGSYAVTADGGTTFDIAYANWDSTETGVWQMPSQLELSKTNISAVDFAFSWNLSASVAGSPAGDIVDWQVFVNTTEYTRTEQRRTLTTGSVWGSFGSGGIIPITTGDRCYLMVNSDDVNALTHRVGSLVIKRL